MIRRQTSRKRFTRSLKAISQWCRKNLHEPLREQVEALGRKLKGHFGYYGITGNYEAPGTVSTGSDSGSGGSGWRGEATPKACLGSA